MLYAVRAKSYLRDSMTGIITERVEIINTDVNQIFKGVSPNPFEIRKRYEHWWNDLNSASKEVVFVTSVDIVD